MNEAAQDVTYYANRGGCYPCQIHNSFTIFLSSQQAYLVIDFHYKNFGLFLGMVSGYKQMFFLADIPLKSR